MTVAADGQRLVDVGQRLVDVGHVALGRVVALAVLLSWLLHDLAVAIINGFLLDS